MTHAYSPGRAAATRWGLCIATGLALALAAACHGRPGDTTKNGVKVSYDQRTGKLSEIAADTNKDGRPDTWGRMDGTRFRVIEVDKDHDGRPDRWEYYLSDGRLEKVGTASVGSGKPDTFYFQDSTGRLARVERTAADGRVHKIEFYEAGRLARAEEDTDSDGKMDRWSTYAGGRLASVAFDVDTNGLPTRRLIYEPDGTVRLEPPNEAAAPAARR